MALDLMLDENVTDSIVAHIDRGPGVVDRSDPSMYDSAAAIDECLGAMARSRSSAESAELLAFANRCQVAIGGCAEARDLPSWLAASWTALTSVPVASPYGAAVVAGAVLGFAERLGKLDAHRRLWRPIKGVGRTRVIQGLAMMVDAVGDGPSLQMVAEHVGVSGSHLSRIIAKETGYGFDTHLHGIRVLRATLLLRDSLSSMKQVADATGYRNLTTFDRQFRRWLKMSPTEFRLVSAPRW